MRFYRRIPPATVEGEKSNYPKVNTAKKEICPSLLLLIHHRSIAWLAKWRRKRTGGKKGRRRKSWKTPKKEEDLFDLAFRGMKNCLKFIRARRSTWLDTVLLAHTADGEKKGAGDIWHLYSKLSQLNVSNVKHFRWFEDYTSSPFFSSSFSDFAIFYRDRVSVHAQRCRRRQTVCRYRLNRHRLSPFFDISSSNLTR